MLVAMICIIIPEYPRGIFVSFMFFKRGLIFVVIEIHKTMCLCYYYNIQSIDHDTPDYSIQRRDPTL
jgi:hypothetical protein